MNYQQKHKEAVQLVNEVLALEEMKDQIVWELAERFYKLKNGGIYKYYYGTDDLKEPHKIAWRRFIREVGENGKHLNENTVAFWFSTYKKWVVELNFKKEELKKYHCRKLHRAIPYTTKNNYRKILDLAKKLPIEDFIITLKENYGE